MTPVLSIRSSIAGLCCCCLVLAASLTGCKADTPGGSAPAPATVTISGAPTAADIGTYANIIISASAGANAAGLSPFTIAVVNPATGSATVLWTPPTQNLDGTALINLAGFHIYFGTGANTLTQMVSVGNPASTTYTLANLRQGTWYFALAAYTSDQVESDLSAVFSKSI